MSAGEVFLLSLLFDRKGTDVPGWPARVLRDVGLLRFTLANSSIRLLAPTTE